MSPVKEFKTEEMLIPEHVKGLIYGHWGSGKTWTLGTGPKPMFLFDLDRGRQTLGGTPGIEGIDFYSKDKRNIRPVLNAMKKKIGELQKECPYKFVAFDSATRLGDYLMWSIIDLNGRWGSEPEMRMQDYGTLAGMLEDWFLDILDIPAHVFITGHAKVVLPDEKSPAGTEALYLPLSTGQAFPQKVGAIFDEVYRQVVTATKGPQETEYRLQTQPDGKWYAKTRLNYDEGGVRKKVLAKYEQPSLEQLFQKVADARQKHQN